MERIPIFDEHRRAGFVSLTFGQPIVSELQNKSQPIVNFRQHPQLVVDFRLLGPQRVADIRIAIR